MAKTAIAVKTAKLRAKESSVGREIRSPPALLLSGAELLGLGADIVLLL
jgi:hypothetical protein